MWHFVKEKKIIDVKGGGPSKGLHPFLLALMDVHLLKFVWILLIIPFVTQIFTR